MINFIICFHTQWEVFFHFKFHPGIKFYSFHPGMKFTCKQKFFHPGTSFIPGRYFILVTCKRTLRCQWQTEKFLPELGLTPDFNLISPPTCINPNKAGLFVNALLDASGRLRSFYQN